MVYFCCSDIHSYYNIFKNSLNEAGFDINNPAHILLICGDLFDRGEDSVSLFNFIKSLPKERLVYIRGNHEDLLEKCLDEMERFIIPSEHHFHNGTVDTVLQFCGMSRVDLWDMYERYKSEVRKDPVLEDSFPSPDTQVFRERLTQVLKFINENCINYYEIGNYIFVHGWIPCESSASSLYQSRNLNYRYIRGWRDSNDSQWEAARWYNGMEAWDKGIREEGKTIVCGHWHTSWGHSRLHHQGKEWETIFTEESLNNFKPFIDEGIIALDGCTAYSSIINVMKLEI